MNKLWCRRWVVLASCVWLVCSCASVGPQRPATDRRPRFAEGATADMVLRYFTEDSIYITKPDIRQSGFRPLLARDDIGREVKRLNVPRNTAVVVLSLFYRDRPQVVQLIQQWTAYLSEQGFRRVVILHAGPGEGIDGLPVLNDSAIGDVNVAGDNIEPPKTSSANAFVSAPVGANVANPSGATIR